MLGRFALGSDPLHVFEDCAPNASLVPIHERQVQLVVAIAVLRDGLASAWNRERC